MSGVDFQPGFQHIKILEIGYIGQFPANFLNHQFVCFLQIERCVCSEKLSVHTHLRH